MSLVGFKAQNHRQQVGRRGAKPEVDNLETPWDFFTPLHERFKFTMCRVEFLPGRLRFIKHGHDRVEPNQRPPFGCCLVIWGRE